MNCTQLSPAKGADAFTKSLTKRLESALNKNDFSALSDLVADKEIFILSKRYRIFSSRFPNAKWTVNSSDELTDGRTSLEVSVTANQQSNNYSFILEAKQKLAFKTYNHKVIGQEVLNEYSILKSISSPIDIRLSIPDSVLTGSRYDVDVIIEKPLGDSLIAGGLISLSSEEVTTQKSPRIELQPMGAGGLFKSVKAPFQPGLQTWAAIIAHPDGIFSITKAVRVVPDQKEIYP